MPPLHGHALPAPPARRTLRWWETPRFEFIMIIRRTERWDSRLSRECRLPSILPFSPRSTVSPDQSLLLHLLLSSPFPTHRRLIAFVSGAYRRRSSTYRKGREERESISFFFHGRRQWYLGSFASIQPSSSSSSSSLFYPLIVRDGARIEGDATAATSFNEPPLRAAVSELPLSMRAAPLR